VDGQGRGGKEEINISLDGCGNDRVTVENTFFEGMLKWKFCKNLCLRSGTDRSSTGKGNKGETENHDVCIHN